jgi:hypothetical protein
LGNNRVANYLNGPNPSPHPTPSALPENGGDPSSGGSNPTPTPSPRPGPSPSPGGGGSGSGEVRFDPSELRKLAGQIETELTAIFKAARYKLNTEPRNVQPDSYTMFAIEAALVYTQMIEFADQDLIQKSQYAIDVRGRMDQAAATYDKAERASTLKEGI